MKRIAHEIKGGQKCDDSRKIDFEILGETGLFGIFGPTGSGKSTILDAITFALFGDVRRAKNGTQGIINTNCRTMRVSFTFELLKQGIRKRYRVERVSQRKKGSTHLSVIKIARLIELTDGGEIPLCDKATDVTNMVTELIGLNQRDFTRAVVLPQNSFQEFLLMNNSDRRRMLERIFYLEEYGRLLIEKLSRKTDGLKSCIDTLSGELRGYQDASDEALLEAKNAMEAAAAEKEKVLKAYKKLEQEFNQAKEIWALVQEMTEVEEREQQHASSAQDISERKLKLDRAGKAEVLVDPIRKNGELTKRLKKVREQLTIIENRTPLVKADLMKHQKSHESLKKERAVEQPKLVAKKARLEDALILKEDIASATKHHENLKATLDKLNNIMAQKTSLLQKETEEYNRLSAAAANMKEEWDSLIIDPEYRQRLQEGVRLEDEAASLKKALAGFTGDAEALRERIAEAEAKLEKIQNTIAVTQKEMEGLVEEKAHYDSMLQDRDAIQKEIQEIQNIRALCGVVKLREDQIKDFKAQVDRIGSLLEEAGKKNQFLLAARDEAAAYCDKYKLQLEEAEKLIDRDAASRLAKQLKDGEACPVCGSEHHPKPATSANMVELSQLESRADEIRAKFETSENNLRKAEAEWLINREQIRTLELQHVQAKENLAAQSRELEMERQKLPKDYRLLSSGRIMAELDRLEKTIHDRKKEVENREKDQESIIQCIQKLNEALSKQRAEESSMLTELKLNRENLSSSMRSLKETQLLREANKKKISEFLASNSISSIRDELDRIRQNDQRLSTLSKEIDRVQQQIRLNDELAGKLKEELQETRAEIIKLETEAGYLINEIKSKEIRIQQLAGDANIQDEIKRIEEQLTQYETRERMAEEKIKILETEHQNLQRNYSLLLNQEKELVEELRNDENRLNKAMKDMGFKDLEDAEKALLPEEERKTLKMAIDEYERTGIKIQADKERISKKLNSRTITEEGWKEISKAWQECSIARENRISESEIASHRYQNLKVKHERWLELSSKLEEANKRMSLFEQIRKLLVGNKGKDNSFIDYVAEERLRYVAARASETLGAMTRYKYALELDADNGFVIRDNANGGVYRMVSTLSGGETFLTSLSLALALSEQIQLKGQSPLEFFFLDEGFGTLDRSLLDSVIDSLERISKKERMIGLISHVPELRSRIGRRLIVEPPSPDGTGTHIYIEKA